MRHAPKNLFFSLKFTYGDKQYKEHVSYQTSIDAQCSKLNCKCSDIFFYIVLYRYCFGNEYLLITFFQLLLPSAARIKYKAEPLRRKRSV